MRAGPIIPFPCTFYMFLEVKCLLLLLNATLVPIVLFEWLMKDGSPLFVTLPKKGGD